MRWAPRQQLELVASPFAESIFLNSWTRTTCSITTYHGIRIGWWQLLEFHVLGCCNRQHHLSRVPRNYGNVTGILNGNQASWCWCCQSGSCACYIRVLPWKCHWTPSLSFPHLDKDATFEAIWRKSFGDHTCARNRLCCWLLKNTRHDCMIGDRKTTRSWMIRKSGSPIVQTNR